MTIHALGPFRLDTQNELLYRGSEPVPLGRRAVALLRVLLERPGVLVSKDVLIEAAWPGQSVEESNLTVQISALRKVLGEGWIETMPRRGYRFLAPAGIAAEPSAAAEPPASPRSAAERRQVTALSCELIGMAGRTEEAGLEALRDAVTAFQRCVSAAAEQHGGLVFSRLGHAALILFGYPVAHEHDAEQAVQAGLTLCADVGALGPEAAGKLRCRVGIASSIAIIGLPGAGREREIIGDAPNLAAQLRLSAPPGMVVIEAATRRLIGDLFDCRHRGTIDSFGGEPLPVWKVLGASLVASRFEALRGPALTELVGRDEELGLLLRLWARAMAGEGQVVLVSGEAGIGKSRLVAALEERLETAPRFRQRYFCSPHHQDGPLFPIADQLARASGFAHDDTPQACLQKLQAFLAGADLPDEDVALLADLLALPVSEGGMPPNLSPARQKQRTLEALSRQLEGLARQQPTVVVFEDAHWIDATSRELLDLIIERARALKLLLIVTFRPEFQPPWTGQPRVTALALNRLDRRDRISLIAQVAGKALPATVLDAIAERADGVPLFVEELTKSVLESGQLKAEPDRYVLDGAAPAVAIPTSLHASLLARLDRSKSARLVAQTGAAIGREFPYGVLRAVSALAEDELRAALDRLVASELVFQRGVVPDARFSFKHALVRDAAYGSLLRGPRRELHARIAQALAEHSPDLIETQPELFAQHYTEAGLVERAIAGWTKAAWRSVARSAVPEASAQFQKALQQLALQPDSAQRQWQELEIRGPYSTLMRFLRGGLAPESIETHARMGLVWEQLGRPLELWYVPYGLAMACVYRGAFDEARQVDETLLRLGRERGDATGLVMGHCAAGQRLFLAGEFQAANPHLEQVLALHDPVAQAGLVDHAGAHPQMTQIFLGLALLCLGFPDQAAQRAQATLAEARRLAHPTSLANTLAFAGLQASIIEDYAALDRWAEEMMALATEQGLPFYQALALMFRGRVRIRNGDGTGGLALLRSGVADYRRGGAIIWLPPFIALLAAGCESAGLVEEAVALLDEALRTMERTGERWFAAELYRHKGELLRRQGHEAAGIELLRTALGIARQQGAKLWELRAAMSLARVYCEQGRDGEAGDLLAPVHGQFTEGFGTADLAAAKSLLEALSRSSVRALG